MSAAKEVIAACADRLYEAQRARNAIAPLTQEYPELTADDAYAIQLVNVNRLLTPGARISGK